MLALLLILFVLTLITLPALLFNLAKLSTPVLIVTFSSIAQLPLLAIPQIDGPVHPFKLLNRHTSFSSNTTFTVIASDAITDST